jgi:predicted short-subunit dehydrogenase-like oxidoreductase (DUF2520 family)
VEAPKIQEVVLIGAGRLATHLGLAFHKLGLKIIQVYNRTPQKGKLLANRVDASFTSDIAEINLTADLYILAVSDSVIEYLASRLNLRDRLIVHASGTMDMSILGSISVNIGVFYPVQTFAPNRKIDFRKIPICIEANSKLSEDRLSALAKQLTGSVYLLDTGHRRLLHLGAVFASNFTNFMYAVTEELLTAKGIPLILLEPLILQTAQNVKQGNLLHSQTGPAVRGDIKVLEKHHELLSEYPDYLEIYKLISDNIIKKSSLHGKL